MSWPQTTRLLVYARAGQCCELCGVYAYGGSLHHRRPRGMGGSKDPVTSSPANALLLCGSGTTGCHGQVEGNRADALERGLLLRQHQDPTTEPVDLLIGRVILGPLGEYIHEGAHA